MNTPRTEVVITVHGSFAANKADRGNQWWQNGSLFAQALERELGQDFKFPEDSEVFHWSGENSEDERRKAGHELLSRLRKLDDDVDYHLIGHSHGGSVIWNALRESAGGGVPLRGIKSWTTMGTPFLHYRVRWKDVWLIIPLVAYVIAAFIVGSLFAQVYEGYHPNMIGEIRRGVGDRTFALSVGLLVSFLVIGILHFFFVVAWPVVRMIGAVWGIVRESRRGERAFKWYRDTWLPFYAVSDEAVNFLRHTVDLDEKILRRLRRPKWFWRFGGTLPDEFINDSLADRFHGNDLGGMSVAETTPSPVRGIRVAPMVKDDLVDRADKNAKDFLHELRAVFEEKVKLSHIVDLILGKSKEGASKGLVHCGYFESSEEE